MANSSKHDHLPRIDYQDHFRMTTERAKFESIDHFLANLVLRQPSWLTMVSMGERDNDVLAAAVAEGTVPAGSEIGNWQVFERGDSWAILGEDLAFLRYRMLYEWIDERNAEASTTVMYPQRLGQLYWGLAKWGHKRFLPMMLRNAASNECEVTQLA